MGKCQPAAIKNTDIRLPALKTDDRVYVKHIQFNIIFNNSD